MKTDDKTKSASKKLTPNERLEIEVIRATKPYQVLFVLPDDTEKVVEILPLPESVLTEGSEHLSKVLAPIANELIAFSVQADNVRRLAEGGGGSEGQSDGPAAVSVSKKKMSAKDEKEIAKATAELYENIFKPATIQKVLKQIPGSIQYLIEVGTTLDYDDVKDDIFVAILFAGKVLIHNIGPRLESFLASDFRRIIRGVGGIERKSVSSKPGTVSTK